MDGYLGIFLQASDLTLSSMIGTWCMGAGVILMEESLRNTTELTTRTTAAILGIAALSIGSFAIVHAVAIDVGMALVGIIAAIMCIFSLFIENLNNLRDME